MSTAVDIRITDPDLTRQVESEKERRGDATLAKTAGKLILERLAQLELINRGLAKDAPVPAPAT